MQIARPPPNPPTPLTHPVSRVTPSYRWKKWSGSALSLESLTFISSVFFFNVFNSDLINRLFYGPN